MDAKLLVCEQRGRHRYFKLADADVAHALEALALVAERRTHECAWANPVRSRLRYARCCYGHLAGKLGVELFAHMQSHAWLVQQPDGFSLTAAGRAGLAQLGLDTKTLLDSASTVVRLAYPCLDWSERRDHLGGRLASALLTHFQTQGWLRRVDGERALVLTPPGRKLLGGLLPSANSF
jgi:hypothetical protein